MSKDLFNQIHDLREQNFELDNQYRAFIVKQAHRARRRRTATFGASLGALVLGGFASVSLSAGMVTATASELRPMPLYVELDQSGSIDLGTMHSLFNSRTALTEVAARFSAEVLGEPALDSTVIDENFDGLAAVKVSTEKFDIRVEIAGDPGTNPAPSSNPFGPWISSIVNKSLENFSSDFALPSPLLLGTEQDLAQMQRDQRALVVVPKLPCNTFARVELRVWDSNGSHVVGSANQDLRQEFNFQHSLYIPFSVKRSTWAFAVVTCVVDGNQNFMLAEPIALLSPNTILDSAQLLVDGERIELKAEDLYSVRPAPWMFQRRFVSAESSWFRGPDTRAPLYYVVRSGLGQLSPEASCKALSLEFETTQSFDIADSRFRCGVLAEKLAFAIFEIRPGLTLEVQNIWVRDFDWKMSLADWGSLANHIQLT